MNILPASVPPWSQSRKDPQGLFDTIFDGVDEAILILEQRPESSIPQISDVNSTFTRWTRIERQCVKGALFSDVLDVDSDHGLDQMAELFSEPRSFEFQSALVSDSYLAIPVHICVLPTRDVNGSGRFTAVARRADKIERQAAELARRERDRALMAREKLLSRLSHDLRTPLNGILGFSEIMKEELFGGAGDERYRNYAHNIHAAGKQLLWKIEELLDLKAVEDGNWSAEERTFDLREAVNQICDDISGCLSDDSSCAVNCVPLGLPSVTADQILFRRAVANLVMTHLLSEWPCDRVHLTAGLTSHGDIALYIDMFRGDKSHERQNCPCASSKIASENTMRVDDDEHSLARGLLTRLGARLDVYRFGEEEWQFILTLPAYRIG